MVALLHALAPDEGYNLTALPITVSTSIVTNQGTANVWYFATNSATNFVRFTIPVTNSLYFTNTFVESNYVSGTATKAWSVAEAVSFTNNTAYKVTNAVSYTYSNGVVVATNAARITTNYQVVATSALVPFTITGTDTTKVTNTIYGASAVDVSKGTTLVGSLSFKLMGAGTSPVGFGYYLTADGSTTNTAGGDIDMFVNANGTTTVQTNFSITVGGYGYMNMVYLTNGNASAVTNLVLKLAQKIAAP